MTTTILQATAASSSSNLNHDASSKSSGGTRQRRHRRAFDPQGVKETNVVEAYVDEGKPMLNNYTRHSKIGGGQHGEVYLCYQLNPQLPKDHPDRRIEVAIKGVKRDNPHDRKFKLLRQQRHRLPTTSAAHTPLIDRLGTAEAKIRKEIAIMKKCRHPHVVRLLEVIDDRMQTKVYMVMEYLHGGEVKWHDKRNNPILSLAQIRRIMRDAILGLEYLHHQGIIHRDIKPANLLWTADRTSVKIADFGVSHFSYAQRLAARHSHGAAGGDEDEEKDPILLDESDLSRRAGTPMFLAPEIIRDFISSGPGDEPEGSTSNINDAAARTPTMNGRSSSHHHTHTSTNSTNLTRTGGPQSSTSRRPSSPPRPIDKAIDIWALGVTFYCLLFGRVPFRPDRENNTEWGLYHAIGSKEWSVRTTMGFDRVWCGSHRRWRSREDDAQHNKNKEEDELSDEADAARWRIIDDEDDEGDDSGTESEKEQSRQRDEGEGNQVVDLLERFLQKDPRNRITLPEAKRDEWFLVEIANPKEWIERTTPRSRITVTASDTTDAMQPVHFRWKWNRVGRRISSLFKSHKPPPQNPEDIMGTTTFRGASRPKKRYDTRGPVKSDPAMKIRRHKSSTAASLSRIQTTNTTPSSPDPASFSWDSTSPIGEAARPSWKEKGKERVVDYAERTAAGKRLQSKSIDRWPAGSRLGVSTKGPDPSSKSTSAIDDQVIAATRRGSLPFLHHHRRQDPGTSNTNTQASSSIASSPTDATGAWYSNQISRASSKSNFRQDSTGSRTRARFAQFLGAISSWRPSRFSSSSTSPTESEKNIKRGIPPPSQAQMSSEALLQNRSPAARSPMNIGPPTPSSGALTPDRRASSWGQVVTPGDNRASMLNIPVVRSLDSALMMNNSSRIVSSMRGLSIANGHTNEDLDEDDYSELGPPCYDDDSSTIASGGEQDDLGDIIRSDSGGEILQPNFEEDDDSSMGDGDSVVQRHVIHNSAPFGDLQLEEEDDREQASANSDSEDEQAPVTFSPRKHR